LEIIILPSPGKEEAMDFFCYKSEEGFSLIELMVALIIIALVIAGGGMFFFHGRVNVIREAHRRAAVLVGSQRLEELKAATWDDIAPEAGDTSDGYTFDPSLRYYLLGSGNWSWIQPAVSENDPPEEAEETKTVDNLSDGKRVTEALWEPGGGSYDYLKVTVTVEWTDNTTNTVSLSTVIASP
jgi:prepilin-type N-terminal cleavage/methylation domain-containing protein